MRSHLKVYGVVFSALLLAGASARAEDSIIKDGREIKKDAERSTLEKAPVTSLKPGSTLKFSSTVFRDAVTGEPTQFQPHEKELQKTVLGTIYTVDPELEKYCAGKEHYGVTYHSNTGKVDYQYTAKGEDARTTKSVSMPDEKPSVFGNVRTYDWDKSFQDARRAKVAFYSACKTKIANFYNSDEKDEMKKMEARRRIEATLDFAMEKNKSAPYCAVILNRGSGTEGTNFQPNSVVSISKKPVKVSDRHYTIAVDDPQKKIRELQCLDVSSLADVRYTLRMGDHKRIQFDPTADADADLKVSAGGNVDWNSSPEDSKVNTKKTKASTEEVVGGTAEKGKNGKGKSGTQTSRGLSNDQSGSTGKSLDDDLNMN